MAKVVHSGQGLRLTMCAGPAGEYGHRTAGVRRMHRAGLTASTAVPRDRGPAPWLLV